MLGASISDIEGHSELFSSLISSCGIKCREVSKTWRAAFDSGVESIGITHPDDVSFIGKFGNLRSTKLKCSEAAVQSILEHIQHPLRLTSLSFEVAFAGSPAVGHLDLNGVAARFSSLTSLNLSRTYLSSQDIKALASLEKLTSLSIPGKYHSRRRIYPFWRPALQHPQDLWQLRRLTSLVVASNGDVSSATVSGITNLAALRSLALYRALDLQNLAGIEDLVQLTQLILCECKNTSMSGVSKLTNLEVLDLSRCGPLSLDLFSTLQKLKRLDISFSHISRHVYFGMSFILEKLEVIVLDEGFHESVIDSIKDMIPASARIEMLPSEA